VYLGAHIGIAGGLANAPAVARSIGADAMQIFSKSPQMWAGPALDPASCEGFRAAVAAEGIRATAVHHGYLTNLASPKASGLALSRRAFLDELRRAEMIGVDALIVHPGAHLGSGVAEAVARVAESLNEGFAQTPGFKVRVLLENMAGQGSTLGAQFTELAQIREGVSERHRVGVAVDTCHLFAAGHDFRTAEGYARVMDQVDHDLGLEHVAAFHLNDAKGPLGSHRDRHENIGKGEIGIEGFRHFVNDPRWRERPGFLETPLTDDDYAAYRADLATLRSLEAPRPAARGGRARPARRARPRSSRSGAG
jgi:deoxyribonuclease IV